MKLLNILCAAAVAGLVVSGQAAAQQVGGKIVDAKPGDVRLLISNGLRVPFEAVKAEAEKVVGHHIVAEYGSSRALQANIEADQTFEVAIVTPDVVDEMIAKGKVAKGSHVDIARVTVGVNQRGGTKGDISTPGKLKDAILRAQLIRFLPTGAARPTVDNVLSKLGVAEAVKGRTGGLIGGNSTEPMPGAGQYELIFNLDSELLTPPPGQVYLGSIPKELQVPAVMTAGIGVKGDTAAARSIVDFLQSSALDPVLKSSRMTR